MRIGAYVCVSANWCVRVCEYELMRGCMCVRIGACVNLNKICYIGGPDLDLNIGYIPVVFTTILYHTASCTMGRIN